MEITLHEKNKHKISFRVQVERLIDALKSCDLGIGTLSDPIQIDGFVSTNHHELDTFYPGETIKMRFKIGKKHPEFQMVCCKLINIGKNFNEGGMIVLNPWDGIFEYKGQKNIITLPDSSLCVIPEGNVCSITIPDSKNDLPEKFNYISYSIIFSITLKLEEQEALKSFFLVMDPVIKVSSNPPTS